MSAIVELFVVELSPPFAPQITSITAPKVKNIATLSKSLRVSPRIKYAIIHTKIGVNEQTTPTVLTLKNLMHMYEISTEMPPYAQRNTKEGNYLRSTESIKSCFR